MSGKSLIERAPPDSSFEWATGAATGWRLEVRTEIRTVDQARAVAAILILLTEASDEGANPPKQREEN